jgi:two-component system nitrogen regulation sensor histidine kinase NtrY
VFSQQCIGTGTEYKLEVSSPAILLYCDASQIIRLIINILKNAEESIEAKQGEAGGEEYKGVIKIKIEEEKEHCMLTIQDNGRGFPEELLDRLTEPYVTTRIKGTGLGLAIVKKIMEDHSGTVELGNKEGWAYVCLRF